MPGDLPGVSIVDSLVFSSLTTKKMLTFVFMSLMKWGIDHKVYDSELMDYVIVCSIVEAISIDDALQMAYDKELRDPIVVGRLISEIDKDGNVTDYDQIRNN